MKIEKVGNKLFTIKDLVHQLELQKKESQSKLILQEDFVSYVIFLFLEENKEKKDLSHHKLVINFSYCLTLLFMQALMLVFYFNEAFLKMKDEDVMFYPPGGDVLAVKYMASVALFLFIFPSISNGITVMKVANNYPKLFAEDTPYAAYFIGFL